VSARVLFPRSGGLALAGRNRMLRSRMAIESCAAAQHSRAVAAPRRGPLAPQIQAVRAVAGTIPSRSPTPGVKRNVATGCVTRGRERRSQRERRLQLAATTSTPRITNQIPVQNGMLSPANDQLISWHSPDPVNTIEIISRNGNALIM
jgi:hypothetical protein